MNRSSIASVPFALAAAGPAQRTHTIGIDVPARPVRRGHLGLGGTNPRGDTITVNSHFIERNGRPFFPIVGEFHYARYPAGEWDDAIRTLQAGGINVAASYVFWNLHERREHQFDWSGNLDLRRFLAVCAARGIFAIVRIGPFCHGEMRNGGLPDWLYGRAFEVRSNDPAYLRHVDRWYAAIAAQVRGHLYRDGGPVIGVQLENEYQHSAAPWEVTYAGAAREFTVAERDLGVTHTGVSVSDVENKFAEDGRAHMTTLKRIAREQGIEVPLYTATGWGNAAIVPQGCVPVTAGYVYPFWAPAAPSPFYLYRDLHRFPDYLPVSYDPELYPSLPAELGPGIMPTYARRTRVPPESVAPLIVRTLGSGSNGIGYYMYHGGSTPVFEHFLSEESGGLPKINYDFQAPVGEYGQRREHFHSLKLLHLFLESFGERLAPMQTILPANSAALTAANTSELRYAVRAAGDAGFVFMHNFQDHLATPDLADLRVEVHGAREGFAFPHAGAFTLRSGASAILPFNLDVGGVRLRSATVQPLTVLRQGTMLHHVFCAIDGLAPELVFAGTPAVQTENGRVESIDGGTIVRGRAGETFTCTVDGHPVLVVPQALALTACKLDAGRLWFAEAEVSVAGSQVELTLRGRDRVDVHVYPAAAAPAASTGATTEPTPSRHAGMSAFAVQFARREPGFAVTPLTPRKFALTAPGGADALGGLHDVMLHVHYVGDRGMAFIDGALVADHFYYGAPWEISLRRFAARLADREMVLVFHPVQRDQAFLADLEAEARPAFGPGQESLLELREFAFVPVYRAVINVL